MKHTLLFLFATTLSALSARAGDPFTAVVNPVTGGLSVLRGSTEYLTIDYFDWGPGWSGVMREISLTESEGKSAFLRRHTIQKTGIPFEIDGSWADEGGGRIAFEATLTPGGDSELVMAQFSLSPGPEFTGQEAVIMAADGSVTTLPIPFGRGTMGDAVKEIVLTDKSGAATRVVFAEPVRISMDNQLRLMIAADTIKQGEPKSLAFDMTLPGPIATFVSGLETARAASTKEMADWYRFDAPSPIPAESEWILSDWLDKPAGKHGRIHQEGGNLVYNGKPIKLWGINNAFSACAPNNDLADQRADFYAALGINSVRLHKYAEGSGWAGILTKASAVEFDPDALDRMDYYVHALKERGIFTKLSPVFIIDIGEGDRDRVPYMDELGPMKGHRINPQHGSFYLSTELQDLLIEQVTKLLDHKNLYTGMRYADDPAIAFVELYNEDSALFGGVASAMAKSPTLRSRGGRIFAEWLKNKYRTEEAFLAAWGPQALNGSLLSSQKLPKDESWAEDRIYPAGNPWFFDPANLNTSQRPFKRRLLDTMEFLYDLQNEVYARYEEAIRKTGYEGELIASNWQAGRMMSHFYNLESDARLGMIDRHNYFGGGRLIGLFNAASMLSQPGSGSFSSSLQQVNGHPFMLSEWIHVLPNEWGVEGPAILGAYGIGLQGWDVSYPFQNTDSGTFSKGIGHSNVWDAAAPNFLGIFPAVSRQVLRGDVRESGVVHSRNVNIASLAEGQVGFEEMVEQQWDVKTFTSDVFPSEALAAARGVVTFTPKFQPTEPFDLAAYRDGPVIRSATGQLAWRTGVNPQDGHIEINTPGTQAVVGFADGRTIDLADAKIVPASRFGAIYLTARNADGVIADDKALLVSAIARARNEGQVVVNDVYVMSRGTLEHARPAGPVVMEPVRASITLKRSGTPTVHVLNHGGVKTGRTVPFEQGSFTIDTARDQTPYYLVEY